LQYKQPAPAASYDSSAAEALSPGRVGNRSGDTFFPRRAHAWRAECRHLTEANWSHLDFGPFILKTAFWFARTLFSAKGPFKVRAPFRMLT